VPLVGSTPRAPKQAVIHLGSLASSPPSFVVKQGGATVLSGTAAYVRRAWQLEQYVVDLSALEAPGLYQVEADGLGSACFEIHPEAYAEVRGRDGLVGVAQTIDSFFDFQRDTHATAYLDVPLWQLTGGQGTNDYPEEAIGGTSGDIRGGWHDATSHDKETATIARALANHAYAAALSTRAADRTALLDEIEWGARYLLKIQAADGSVPIAAKPYEQWAPTPKPPIRLLVNVDVGVVAKVAASLAASAAALKDRNPSLARESLAGAKLAYGYVVAHPNGFIPSNYYPAYWRGSAASVLGANVELALTTGEQTYIDAASSLIQQGTFRNGLWVKQSGTFPGQLGWEQDEGAQPVVFLLRFHALADDATRQRIASLSRLWRDHWMAKRGSAYGITDSMIVPWFGGNGQLTMLAQGLLMMGVVLGDEAAAEYGLRNFEWTVGTNPFGTSFVWGLGRESSVLPFLRPEASSMGAVMPGFVTANDGSLSIAPYSDPARSWMISEATIDSSSTLNHVLGLLNALYGG
jgi:hypothetical protein